MGTIRSQQGSALVFVVLVCAVLLFLGTSLFDLNSVDLQIAANQRDSLQAYYLAETGVEGALAVLKEHDPYYIGNSTAVLGEGTLSVAVSALEEAHGGRRVYITSTAQSGRVQEGINLKFQAFPPYNGGTDGAVLGWYDETNGHIIPGEHTGANGAVLLGFSGTDMPLTLQQQEENGEGSGEGGGNGEGEGEETEDGGARFTATELYFISKPTSLVLEEGLAVCATTVVFYGSVLLCPDAGSLQFIHPDSAAVHVYLRDRVAIQDHHVLLEPGVYSFPHNYLITGTTNPEEINDYRVLPVVPGTMLWQGRGE